MAVLDHALVLALAIGFLAAGLTKLLAPKRLALDAERWGYSIGFLRVVATAELALALGLVLPEVRLVACLVAAGILIGAVATAELALALGLVLPEVRLVACLVAAGILIGAVATALRVRRPLEVIHPMVFLVGVASLAVRTV